MDISLGKSIGDRYINSRCLVSNTNNYFTFSGKNIKDSTSRTKATESSKGQELIVDMRASNTYVFGNRANMQYLGGSIGWVWTIHMTSATMSICGTNGIEGQHQELVYAGTGNILMF